MGWYIDCEFFRCVCVFMLSSRLGGTLLQKAGKAIQWAYPSLLIPIFFLAWRLFFFHSERGATDTDVQFELVRLYPIQTLFHWAVQVLQDLFDVILSAWVTPLSQLMGYIQRWGGIITTVVVALVLFVLIKLNNRDESEESSAFYFPREALLLGFLSAVAG